MRFLGFLFFLAVLVIPQYALTAEIYQYIDPSGTIHFTNVPTDSRFKPMRPKNNRRTAPEKMDALALETYIHAASKAQQLSPALIKAVIRAESNFNPMAVSTSGAQGLMQLMPDTAEDLKLGNPFDPEENIHGGTRYLRYLLDRFDQDLQLAIAAYHAGPGNVLRHGGVPPIKQTQNYLKKVLRFFEYYLDETR